MSEFIYFNGGHVYALSDLSYYQDGLDEKTIKLDFGDAFRGGSFVTWFTPAEARACAAALIAKAEYAEALIAQTEAVKPPVAPSGQEPSVPAPSPDDDMPF
jgi:hypothetical protein